MDIESHAAIVTGGGSGLGAAVARGFAAAGAKVAVFDVNEKAARETAEAIGGLAVQCDVRDATAAEKAVAVARSAHGAARVLVNCAGVGTAGRAVGREAPLPLADFEKVIGINLVGTFNIIRLVAADLYALDALADHERGVIVNTASVAAFDGQIGQPAYAASKGGVAAMTLPLAREFAAKGIRVMTIAPGIFMTPMLEGLPKEVQDSLGQSVPFPRRVGNPSEFASLVSHIVSNTMLNGEVIRLDGAIRMAPK